MARRWIFAVMIAPAALIGCSNNKSAQAVDLPPPVVVEPVVVAEPVLDYPESGAPTTYSIRRGDTLWSLASRYYSNGQRWRDIAAANPGIDPKRMRVGQMVVIP